MAATLSISPAPAVGIWRDCLAPREHGSWSLAFEPIVLALLAAPSVPGALLALAFAAVFFARRPCRLLSTERRPARRAAARWALGACAGVAAVALLGALVVAGTAWLPWLVPMGVAGAGFAWFDWQGSSREGAAEVAGAAAFALAPAALLAIAGRGPEESAALAVLMLGRSVPSVLYVRAFLRAARTGIRRDGPAVAAAIGALAVAVLLAARGLAPWFSVAAMWFLALRVLALLVALRPAWRASRIGMLEAVLGAGFVLGLALTWM